MFNRGDRNSPANRRFVLVFPVKSILQNPAIQLSPRKERTVGGFGMPSASTAWHCCV